MPLEFVIRLVKLAYNFEHWDTMDVLMEPTLKDIKVCVCSCLQLLILLLLFLSLLCLFLLHFSFSCCCSFLLCVMAHLSHWFVIMLQHIHSHVALMTI